MNAVVQETQPVYNVGLYVRYSTEEQKQNSFSEEMQTDQCMQKLRQVYGQGPYDVRTFKDLGKSGAIGLDNPAFGGKEHREGLEALLAAMVDGELDVVLCYAQDRLARDEFLWHYMNATIFQKCRVPILFARDGHDLLTEEGQMIGTLHALSASLERRKISRNVAAACERRAAEGYRQGPPPYGWRFDPDQEMGPRARRRIVRQEAEGAILLECKERYMRGWPTASIVQDLHRRGIYSASGDLRWTGDGVLRILTNPVHAGLVRHKDQIHSGQHQALRYWTPEEREALLLRAAERRDHPLVSSTVETYLLGGVIFCGHCGRRLGGTYSPRRKQRQYACHAGRTGGRNRRRAGGAAGEIRNCPAVSRVASELEEAVVQAVAKLARSAQVQDGAQQRLRAAMEEQDRRLREELKAIAKDLSRVQQGFSRLFAMLDEGRITPEEFRGENERRRAEQTALEERRAQRQAELQQRSHRTGEFTAAMELLRDFDRLWGKMNMAERKELLRRIDPHMTLHKEDDVVVLTIRPGWTVPITIPFVRRMPRQGWARGPQAPLTRAQLSFLCAWQDGLDLHAIAQARDISIGAVYQNMYRLQERLQVTNLDQAVELVKDRMEKFRATVRTEGRFQKRPPADPTLLTKPLLAVLRLMAEGMTGQAISAALGKDKSTISRQMTAICNRLAAHGREDAVVRGRELGLI